MKVIIVYPGTDDTTHDLMMKYIALRSMVGDCTGSLAKCYLNKYRDEKIKAGKKTI